MTAPANPALDAFVADLGESKVVAQVLIRRTGNGFTLRHIADEAKDSNTLAPVALDGLRALAQNTAAGAFRPIKAAPNLRSGWIASPRTATELGTALEHLYPGFVSDWFAAKRSNPPVTHYRPFVERQTGMYRITAMLDDTQAARTIRSCCAERFCLKRRLWTVPDLSPDAAESKSVIPCLEPCPVMLEFARKVMRIEQEDKVTVSLSPSELETLKAALGGSAGHAENASDREADFSSATNPRRLALLLDKLSAVPLPERPAGDSH